MIEFTKETHPELYAMVEDAHNEYDRTLDAMTDDEAQRWELEILSQLHKDQADRATDWLAKQGYWITEITRGDKWARQFTINFGAATIHGFDTDMIEFAKSKGWKG